MVATWDSEAGRANWAAIRGSQTLSTLMFYIHPPRAPALVWTYFQGLLSVILVQGLDVIDAISRAHAAPL